MRQGLRTSSDFDQDHLRHGFSLIEMSVVIALLGMLSLVGTSLLTHLMELDSSITSSTHRELNVSRLEDQLIEDTRTTTELTKSESGLNLKQASGELIEYRIDSGVVQRRIDRDRRRSIDTFSFPESRVQLLTSPRTIEVVIQSEVPGTSLNQASLLRVPDGSSSHLLVPIGRVLRFDIEKQADERKSL